jgi:hypothetical protein
MRKREREREREKERMKQTLLDDHGTLDGLP